MLRHLVLPLLSLALASSHALAAKPAATRETLATSVDAYCGGRAGTGLEDMARDPAASLVVDVTLYDRRNRVLDQFPMVTLGGGVAFGHSVALSSFSVRAGGGVTVVDLCLGRAAAVRVTPDGAGRAGVELFLEAVALRGKEPAPGQVLDAAPQREVVHIEKTLRMSEGDTATLNVGGTGPVGRVTLTYGRLR